MERALVQPDWQDSNVAGTDDVVRRLRAALPAGRVQTGAEINPKHGTDLSRYPANGPAALLMPRSTEEVSRMLEICHAARQPLVPQGGLTGTNGGAHPGPGEIAITLEKLTGVEDIDAAGVLVAYAGTPLEVIQQTAREAGWHCGIDIGSRGSCTIGGNVATNAGGNAVIRYGMTRDNVLGLEVVLADGRVLDSLNRLRKNTSGYDLKQLFIGSEGTLGVITKVALQLQALPTTHECAFVATSCYEAALALLRRAQLELCGAVSAFEVMWPDYYEFMVDRTGLAGPLPCGYPLYLLLDIRGSDPAEDIVRLETLLEASMERGEVVDAVVARSQADIERLWRVREDVPRIHPFLPERANFDVSVPIASMQQAVDEIRSAVARRWPDAVSLFFGHIGDGNVHIVVAFQGLTADADAVDTLVFDIVRQFRGAIAAEHGIGRKRRAYLGHSRTAQEIEVMCGLKQLLDPRAILNPGKVI